jgi:two-component system, OmpR family, sensor histidine kinase TctE
MSFASRNRLHSALARAGEPAADAPAACDAAPASLPPDFVWFAAHQLRTRLSVLQAGVDEAGRLSRGRLRLHVEHLRRLLDQLLVVALSDDLGPVQRRAFDLNALAAEVAAQFGPLVQRRRCCLHVEAWESPVVVRGHYGLSFEALSNLVDNAMKYGGEGASVTVRVCPFCTVTVLDDGPGVPEAARPRLFAPFNLPCDRPRSGAGLGLFIVSRVMAAQGGSIAYEPGVPQGSRFVMRFGDD